LTGKAEDKTYFSRTKGAFNMHLDSFEPRDYWRMVSIVQESLAKPSLEYLMLLVKFGNWDPMTFNALFPAFRQGIEDASASQKWQLAAIIDRVWEHFYSITPEDGDFVLNLGVLLYDLKDYEGAIKYFERSMDISGPNQRAMQNIAACRSKIRGRGHQ
jgi:tetratricopeptide (TPR) repeat protein